MYFCLPLFVLQFKAKDVLSKYDEEIDGIKKEKFELGSGGTYDTDQDRQMDLIRQQLRNQSQSLDISDRLKVASEYLTEQEIEVRSPEYLIFIILWGVMHFLFVYPTKKFLCACNYMYWHITIAKELFLSNML